MMNPQPWRNIMEIDEIFLESLKILYDRCCKQLGVNPGELIIRTFNSNKNTIYNSITSSCFETTEFDPQVTALMNKGYIRPFESKSGSFLMTAKGAWVIEKTCYGKTEDDLINVIDERYFCTEIKKLNDKNRMILLALVCTHAFYEGRGLNYAELGKEQGFISLMQESFQILSKTKRISVESFESFFSKKSTQKKRSAVLTSSINDLSKCTFSICVTKSNCYYLNLYKNGIIDSSGLKTILQLIFGPVRLSEVDDIIRSCKEVSLKYCSIYASDDQISDIYCNDLIENCINNLAGL